MESAWALWTGLGGMVVATAATSAFWSWKNRQRFDAEIDALQKAMPSARDGLVVSALAIDLTPKGHEPAGWFSDLIPMLDEIVAKTTLRRVGAFQGTYMVVGTDERVASSALRSVAQTALDLRDRVMLYSAMREVPMACGCAIHADIVPTIGLGSTVALSQLWSETLALADRAKDGQIDLSSQSAEWLGTEFDINMLGERPVLHARKVA